MSSDVRRAVLELLGARGVSRAQVRSLMAARLGQGTSFADAAREVAKLLEQPPDDTWLAAQLAAADALGLRIVALGQETFPDALAAIPDPPLALFVAGRLPLPAPAPVAIVGSRNGSAGSCAWAFAVADALARAGIPVVSGLALGVDGAAHRGCLEAGGTTVAFLGAGHRHLYPRRHRPLAAAICEKGAVVSEYPPLVAPHRHQFPERNRLISGLSRAVIVVEAGPRSGSLITARCALEQGRDVMAVPGLPGGRASGCHRLIQSGAALVESREDVFDTLGEPWPIEASQPEELDAALADVLAGVGIEPVTVDELAVTVGLPAQRLREALVHLELCGFVAPEGGGYIRRPR